MMLRVTWFKIMIGSGILLLLSFLFIPSGIWQQAMVNPWMTLAGSERQLHATLLDVSQSGESSLKNATRRVLKPFGTLTLIRFYPSDDGETPSRRPIP